MKGMTRGVERVVKKSQDVRTTLKNPNKGMFMAKFADAGVR